MVSGKDLLDLATTAARRAAAFLRTVDRPRDSGDWDRKGASDFVTEVDRASERLIAEVLGTAGGTVVGEELSPKLVRDGLVWIVDPLDGTTNYLHEFPSWSVSIAAAVDGELRAGVVYDIPGERLYAASRGGASCNGRPIQVSSVVEPTVALIGTGFPFKDPDLLPDYQRQFARVLRSTSGVRRTGSAAIDLAMVAAGRVDGFWELRLAPWDIAAGILLVREAGGLATDLRGRALVPGHGPVVAGNPTIQPWLLAAVAAAEVPAGASIGGPE